MKLLGFVPNEVPGSFLDFDQVTLEAMRKQAYKETSEKLLFWMKNGTASALNGEIPSNTLIDLCTLVKLY